jgi:tRNA(fMet)-specific endonuclease VapC
MRYLLDTNICIYLIKRHPVEVLKRLEALRQGDVVISVVTHAELRAGLAMQTVDRAHDEQVLGLLTRRIPVLPFDEAASLAYGVLRAAVPDRRHDALDRLIAAHAVSVGATLVTNNEADFNDYPGLVVESWVENWVAAVTTSR